MKLYCSAVDLRLKPPHRLTDRSSNQLLCSFRCCCFEMGSRCPRTQGILLPRRLELWGLQAFCVCFCVITETLRQVQGVSSLGRRCQEVRRKEETRGFPWRPKQGQEFNCPHLPLSCTLLQARAVLSCQLPGAEATTHTGRCGREHTPVALVSPVASSCHLAR